METLTTVLGFLLVAMPLILTLLAWRAFRANPVQPTGTWQKSFRIALAGITSNYFLFWIDFMVVPVLRGSPDFISHLHAAIGWVGELLAVIFLVLSFAGRGVETILAILASIGVLLMWVSIGFY